jgi:hypothetical protein
MKPKRGGKHPPKRPPAKGAKVSKLGHGIQYSDIHIIDHGNRHNQQLHLKPNISTISALKVK